MKYKIKKLICYFVGTIGLSMFAVGLSDYLVLNLKLIIDVFHYTSNYLLITNMIVGGLLLLGSLYQLYYYKHDGKNIMVS